MLIIVLKLACRRTRLAVGVAAALFVVLTALSATRAFAQAQEWNSSLATWSTAGKGEPILNGYKEVTLAEHQGTGCLTHMWFGGE